MEVMNPPCIINVAHAERYWEFQDRLLKNLDTVGYKGERMVWRGKYPPDSPTHEAVNYAFKLFAFAAAQKVGYRTILWLDAGIYAIRSLDPIFEKIKRDGHFLVTGTDRLGTWSGDDCLNHYNISRDQAMDIKLISGSMIGLNLDHPRARSFYSDWWQAYHQDLYRGERSKDPRCEGHRADEAPMTCIANYLGMNMSLEGEEFRSGGGEPAGDAILRSGYYWDNNEA